MVPLIVERGPLSVFYTFKKNVTPHIPWEEYHAVSQVSRSINRFSPLYTSEYNSKIPPYYVFLRSFHANDRNDYSNLDQILNQIEEKLLITLTVEPTDIAFELENHTAYLAKLDTINRRDRSDFDLTNMCLANQTEDWAYQSINSPTKKLQYEEPLSKQVLRNQQRFHETLFQKQLQFCVTVFAQTQSVAKLIANVLCNCGFDDNAWNIDTFTSSDTVFHLLQDRVKCYDVFIPEIELDSTPKIYMNLRRLLFTAPGNELEGLIRLPIGNYHSPLCMRMDTDPDIIHESKGILTGFSSYYVKQHNMKIPYNISYSLLPKGGFLSGMPGSGKTSFIRNWQIQLHSGNYQRAFNDSNEGTCNHSSIPFLAIDTAKLDSRIFKFYKNHPDSRISSLAKDLRIYTAKENVSLFKINFFELQPGISKNEHIDNIMHCFKAAMPMSGPLPSLIEETLTTLYKNYDKDNPPMVRDFMRIFEIILEAKHYERTLYADIRAAVDVRLRPLLIGYIGKIFHCRHSSPSIPEIVNNPCVLEIDCLSVEKMAFLTLVVLTLIKEYYKTIPVCDRSLRHVIFLDEAHLLVGNNTDATVSESNPDPKAFAAEFIIRWLAEMRSLKVGLIISDQLPSAVAAEVIKNTATKVGFKQVAEDERIALGQTMLFKAKEHEEIARFLPGDAYLYTEGFHKPIKIKTILPSLDEKINDVHISESIIPHIENEDWHKDTKRQNIAADLSLLHEDMDQFDQKRILIAEEFTQLISALHQPTQKATDLNSLYQKIHKFECRLKHFFYIFKTNTYSPVIKETEEDGNRFPEIKKYRDQLIDRFNNTIQRDTESFLKRLSSLKQRLRPTTQKG